jgi:hypothetical protein
LSHISSLKACVLKGLGKNKYLLITSYTLAPGLSRSMVDKHLYLILTRSSYCDMLALNNKLYKVTVLFFSYPRPWNLFLVTSWSILHWKD